jgi:hypothetical protein
MARPAAIEKMMASQTPFLLGWNRENASSATMAIHVRNIERAKSVVE